MSDMELVIKIHEETYKKIQSRDWKNGGRWFSEEWKAIHNGVLLPKGHGNLIDYYDAVELINNKADEENSNFTINDIEKFGALLREVNPIIEADKAESEDKECR